MLRCAAVKQARVHVLAPIAIGVIWAMGISRVYLWDMTDVGLISVLPPSALLAIAFLTVSFAFALRRDQPDPVVLLAHVLVLMLMLYAVTALLEPVPRFSSVYRHVGIIEYITAHGSVDPGIDAYFNWPAFFGLGGLLTKIAGWDSAIAMAAWAPMVFNLLYLPPLLVIFGWATDDLRVKWLAVWVFYSANWVGQDYLSPQAVGFLLWLAMLAILLRWFAPRVAGLAPARSFRELLRHLGPPTLRAATPDGLTYGITQSVAVMGVAVLMYGATVSGHQLTPFAALTTVTGLALFAGLRTRWLPLTMGLTLAAWIGFMTTTYLAGHFADVSGDVGSVSGALGSGVRGRLAGSEDHQLVAQLRVIMSIGVWGLALAGFLRRLSVRRVDVAMGVIALAPFSLPVLQAYGGEVFIRLFLYALPATAFFIASLAFPTRERGRGALTTVGIVAVGCLILLAFQYARHGNERMDAFRPSDAAAVRALYRIAPKGATIIAGNGNLPWRYRGYADYRYFGMNDFPQSRVPRPDPKLLFQDVLDRLPPTGGYVILTRSTYIHGELFQGQPNLLPGFLRVIRASPLADALYHSPEADIFFLRVREGQPRSSPRSRSATRSAKTTIMNVELAWLDVTTAELDTTKRSSNPCTARPVSSTPSAGWADIRVVPSWWNPPPALRRTAAAGSSVRYSSRPQSC